MQFSISSASTYAKQVVNAALTFAFGYQYAAGLLPDIPEAFAPWVAGLLYFAVFDGGALGWNAKAELPDLSERQYQVADGMATLCTYASTVISAAHILLSLKLFQLPGVVTVAGIVATIATVAVIGLHFVFLRVFRLHDPIRAEKQLRSIVAAKVQAAKLEHFRTVQVQAVSRVKELAGEHVGELAEIMARNLVLDFKASARKSSAKPKTKAKTKRGNGRRRPTKKEKEKEVKHSKTDEAYIEFEEVAKDASEAAASNLNMSPA